MAKIFKIEGIDITISDKASKDYKNKTLMDLETRAVKTYVRHRILEGETDPAALSEYAEKRLYEDINDLHFRGKKRMVLLSSYGLKTRIPNEYQDF